MGISLNQLVQKAIEEEVEVESRALLIRNVMSLQD